MRAFAIAIGIILLTGFGAAVTELSLAVGDQTAHSPAGSTTTQTSPSPSATPSVTPTTSASPAATTAVTNSYVYLRASASTGSPSLAGLPSGTTVQLTGKLQGQWQPASYQGQNGYIDSSYLDY